MDGKIDLEIVTPKGRALSAQVDEVTAPGADGEFGIMPGHLPLLAAIRTGLVSYRIGQDQKRCAVGSGFAEAGADKLVILTDEYIEREGIDPVLVRKELGEVQKELETLLAKVESTSDENSRKKHLISRENWCAAELELYGDPPPPTMRPQSDFVEQDKQVIDQEADAALDAQTKA